MQIGIHMHSSRLSDADYRLRAEVHKPGDPLAMRDAAVDMAIAGLTARDISVSLGITEQAVRSLLRTQPHDTSPSGDSHAR